MKIWGDLAKYGGCSAHEQSPSCDWLWPSHGPGGMARSPPLAAACNSCTQRTVRCTLRPATVPPSGPSKPCNSASVLLNKPCSLQGASDCWVESPETAQDLARTASQRFRVQLLPLSSILGQRRADFGAEGSLVSLGGSPSTAARRAAWGRPVRKVGCPRSLDW